MAGQDLVRPSRDGDQFHYHWAARQSLRLLPGSASDLVAVTVEGPSAGERPGAAISEGEELIDVGLYYGAEDRRSARLVHYIQLKHSTRHAEDPWTASGLENTLAGFAKRYTKLLDEFPRDEVARRFRFEFTSNRPIALDVREALADIASGSVARHRAIRDLLVRYSGLVDERAADFFALFSVTGGEKDLWAQRNLLSQDVNSYLPDVDYDAPVQLKELVTRKATTEYESDPAIRLPDVLRALKATEEDLRPAPSLIPDPKDTLPREQENDFRQALLTARTPVLIHADGGLGKSVLAARIAASMPEGCVAVLYDCFGNGLYRNSLNFRHRHRDALVQIANELAARGLCHPLIPSLHADEKRYMRAFVGRLEQAIGLMRAADPSASLCLIIDAADNAEIAAEEQGEAGSFARDLIRTPLPEGVRLAITCRTHRRDRLRPPPGIVELQLSAFSAIESSKHLRTRYPDATDANADEFARLSSSNPRVQALALSWDVSLDEMLKRLGPKPTTIERAMSDVLKSAIARLQDSAGDVEAAQIQVICQGLAVLRPLVPVAVLATISASSESAVRSFATDLGRPILFKGESLQFLDEPTETWFREQFQPDRSGFVAFLERLRPLAASSAYAAAALPQLLLQAGKLDELVSLALSDDDLPSGNPLERRDVKLQRLRFALKACLQRAQYAKAAMLALKAGGESAGEQRQNHVIHDHTDVAAILMAPDRLAETVARRTFRDTWMGSHHAYDAGLLSGRAEYLAEASSHLRMAKDWLDAWARLPSDTRHGEPISTDDVAEIALVMLRVEGATPAVRFLRGWRPRYQTLLAGRVVARRLVDLGRYDQLEALAEAAGHDVWLLLALATEANGVGHAFPVVPLDRLLRILGNKRVKLDELTDWEHRWTVVDAVRSAIELALQQLPPQPDAWAQILGRYLPSPPPDSLAMRTESDRPRLLRAYALQAALRNTRALLSDVTPAEVREQQQSNRRTYESELFLQEAGGILPWLALSADIACGRPPKDLSAAVENALKEVADAERRTYRPSAALTRWIALEWLQILRATAARTDQHVAAFRAWVADQNLAIDTLIHLCRCAARANGFASLAMECAERASKALEADREETADSRSDSYVWLARAILVVSSAEARAYFDRAVEIASQIGDENIDRWLALLDLASTAAERDRPRPETAYRLSRFAEVTRGYVERDKHFPWTSTMHALTDLCGSSALTILSRWRDRRFGDTDRLLPILIDRLVADGRLPPVTPLVLAGTTGQWDRVTELKRYLDAEQDPKRRERAAQLAYRYMRLLPGEVDTWLAVVELGQRFNLEFSDAPRLVAAARPGNESDALSASSSAPFAGNEASIDWNALLATTDMTSSVSLRSSYSTMREWPEREAFFKAAFSRVMTGREAEFVRAIAAWSDFGVLTLEHLLGVLPSPIPNQLALRSAVRDAVLQVCRREPQRIRIRGWQAWIPVEKLRAGGAVTDEQIVSATLDGFADQVDRLTSTEFFQIVEPLASTLTPSEAEEALNFGFALLDEILKPDDGDGPWQTGLLPPSTISEALAGYIWAGLGSPIASERWQHAHVVRAIVELDCSDLLRALLAKAETNGGGPFVDQRLSFYSWHAREWLLIGLARGAIQRPEALAPAHALLRRCLEERHVVIRDLAAQAIGMLVRAGELEHDLSDKLAPNRPKSEVLYDSGMGKLDDERSSSGRPINDDEKYYFGLDIGPYWFNELGKAFGLTQQAIERRALAMIREQLGWSGGYGWREDARHARKLFDEGETSHSHGSLPRTDGLDTYHAYHAMMLVAAELLNERPVRRHADDRIDEFSDWLSRYLLTRDDGKWLADQRSPRIPSRNATIGIHDKAWRWSVTAEYLDEQLVTDDGMNVLWGEWRNGESEVYETVSVSSALVSRVGAEALLAALQTAERSDRFFFPDPDEEDEVQAGPLRLMGLVSHKNVEHRLDARDPWGEAVAFPGPAPSAEVISRLGLVKQQSGTTWIESNGGKLRAELWTQISEYGRERDTLSGERLSANPALLKALLDAYPDRLLIICVEVQRRVARYGRDDEFESYPWPYVRYYLMGADGAASTL